MIGKRTISFITLATLVWAVLATILGGYYYLRFQEIADLSREFEAVIMYVDIYIDYGNGTKVWHNNTLVPVGFTLLNATKLVADVDADDAGAINAIDGVAFSLEESKSWFWWRWDMTASRWVFGELGANQHMLHHKDIVAWAYQSYAEWPPPPPS